MSGEGLALFPFPATAMGCALAISMLCLLLAAMLQHSQRRDGRLPTVPPLVSCGLVGLLTGLSLLVLLPSALDGLVPQGYSSYRVLVAFAAGPVLMYVLNNVVLDHQCCAEQPPTPPPAPRYVADDDAELDIGEAETCEPADEDEAPPRADMEEMMEEEEEEEPAWLSSAASDVGIPSPADPESGNVLTGASRRRSRPPPQYSSAQQPEWSARRCCVAGECEDDGCPRVGRFANPARSPTPTAAAGAVPRAFAGKATLWDDARGEGGSGYGGVGGGASVDGWSRAHELCAMLVRLAPWFAHALLDGWMLGCSHSVPLLLALALPVAVCACQDTASLVLGEAARSSVGTCQGAGGEQRPQARSDGGGGGLRTPGSVRAMRAVGVFATAFPMGTALALWLSRTTNASGARLLFLRALTAGAFLYMALCDFAPKGRPHGRRQALVWLAAFTVGLGAACLAEAFEDLMTSAVHAATTTSQDRGGAAAAMMATGALLPPAPPPLPAAGAEVKAAAAALMAAAAQLLPPRPKFAANAAATSQHGGLSGTLSAAAGSGSSGGNGWRRVVRPTGVLSEGALRHSLEPPRSLAFNPQDGAPSIEQDSQVLTQLDVA